MWKYILKHLGFFTYSSFISGSSFGVQLCVCEAKPNADLVVASMFIEKRNDGFNVVFLDDV